MQTGRVSKPCETTQRIEMDLRRSAVLSIYSEVHRQSHSKVMKYRKQKHFCTAFGPQYALEKLWFLPGNGLTCCV